MSRALAAALAIVFLAASPAWAYIDPGAGSLLLQLILGGIGGLIVAVKLFWRRIRVSRDKTE
jgi:hypothetical protein